jgi:hypothetical protein
MIFFIFIVTFSLFSQNTYKINYAIAQKYHITQTYNTIQKSFLYSDITTDTNDVDKIIYPLLKKNVTDYNKYSHNHLNISNDEYNNYLYILCNNIFDSISAANTMQAIKQSSLINNCISIHGKNQLYKELIVPPCLSTKENYSIVQSRIKLITYLSENNSNYVFFNNIIQNINKIENKIKKINFYSIADTINTYKESIKKTNIATYIKNFINEYGMELFLLGMEECISLLINSPNQQTGLINNIMQIIKTNGYNFIEKFTFQLFLNPLDILFGITPQSIKESNQDRERLFASYYTGFKKYIKMGLDIPFKNTSNDFWINHEKRSNIFGFFSHILKSPYKEIEILLDPKGAQHNTPSINFNNHLTSANMASLIYKLGQLIRATNQWKDRFNKYNLYKKFENLIILYQNKIKLVELLLNNLIIHAQKQELIIPELIILNDIIKSSKYKKEKQNLKDIISIKNRIQNTIIPITLANNFIKLVKPLLDINLEKHYSVAESYTIETMNELIGFMDGILAKIKTLKSNTTNTHKYSIPEFSDNTNNNFSCINIWNPLGAKNIENSFNLEQNNYHNMLLISQYGSGKTFLLRTILTGIYFANLGIVPAEKIIMPFFGNNIFQNLSYEMTKPTSNISKHMAENIFIRNITKHLDNTDEPCLIIMDELYSGTSPQQQSILIKEHIIKLLQKKNVFNIFTTHYPENIVLLLKPENHISLYYLKVNQISDTEFERTFTLTHDPFNTDNDNWWLKSNNEKANEYRKYMIEVENKLIKKKQL